MANIPRTDAENYVWTVVSANYFPVGVVPQNLYESTDRGFEAEMRERLGKVRARIRAS